MRYSKRKRAMVQWLTDKYAVKLPHSVGKIGDGGSPPMSAYGGVVAKTSEWAQAVDLKRRPDPVPCIAATCALAVAVLSGCSIQQATGAAEPQDAGNNARARDAPVAYVVPGEARLVSESENIPTALKLLEGAKDRGFAPSDPAEATEAGMATESDQSVRGNTLALLESEDPETEIPHFHFSWEDANGVQWRVFANDGRFFAAPASRDGIPVQADCILSETEGVIQYSPTEETFIDFEGSLMDGGVDIVKVDSINADTLAEWAEENLPAADDLQNDEDDGEGADDENL